MKPAFLWMLMPDTEVYFKRKNGQSIVYVKPLPFKNPWYAIGLIKNSKAIKRTFEFLL